MIRSVRELLRSKARFFLLATGAALALRLFLVWRFPAVVDDSRLYADIAKNWLQHGIYGITNSGQIVPTLSRLPGYPAFLAAIFAVFGLDNFKAVLLIQVLFDLGTCFLIADMARRLFSARAAQAAFLLAGLCPFLANYAAAALTETLEIFFTTLALHFALRGLGIGEVSRPRRLNWIGCGLSIAAAILLRPDGGILLAAIGGYLFWLLLKSWKGNLSAADSVPRLAPRELMLCRNPGRSCRPRPADPLDVAQPSHAPPLSAPGSALCHRLRRVRHARLQSLGENLDRRLRFRAGDLLAGSRIGHRFLPPAQSRLRFCRSSAQRPLSFLRNTTKITI